MSKPSPHPRASGDPGPRPNKSERTLVNLRLHGSVRRWQRASATGIEPPAYAELAVTTNFSFLRGASHPKEMVATADALGLAAIGIADRNSFAGVVRAFETWKKIEKRKAEEAEQTGAPKEPTVKLLVGTRLVTTDGFEVLAYPTDRAAYGRLCRLLTAGNRKIKKGEKGECLIFFEGILAASQGQMLIALPPEELSSAFTDRLAALVDTAPGRSFLAGGQRYRGDEPRRLAAGRGQ
jgi:error-prone DNA polymerase